MLSDRERAEKAEARVKELEAECASMSAELGLPPTMRPAEGELRRMRESWERVGAAIRHCRAVRDGVCEPLLALRRIENVLTVPYVHPSHMPETADSVGGVTCGACGLTHEQEPTVVIRQDGSVRCNDCWRKDVEAMSKSRSVRPLRGAYHAARLPGRDLRIRERGESSPRTDRFGEKIPMTRCLLTGNMLGHSPEAKATLSVLIDIVVARRFVRDINSHLTHELAAQALAREFAEVRRIAIENAATVADAWDGWEREGDKRCADEIRALLLAPEI